MQKILLSVILELLYRALRVLERRDGSVARELQRLPDGTCVRIRTSLTSGAPQLTVVHGRGALRTFTGCASIGQAYCAHRFVLKGNINETMCLVRAIETAESYLFPRFWNRRILKHRVEKRLPTLAVYALALCGRS